MVFLGMALGHVALNETEAIANFIHNRRWPDPNVSLADFLQLCHFVQPTEVKTTTKL